MKLTHDDIRRVGGIVHSDGNIFFTNIDKLQQLVFPLEAKLDICKRYAEGEWQDPAFLAADYGGCNYETDLACRAVANAVSGMHERIEALSEQADKLNNNSSKCDKSIATAAAQVSGLLQQEGRDPRDVAALGRLSAELALLQVKVVELEDLSVTKIMLDVQPGFEGEGVEVYAKSVAEVEQLLGSMGERLENFELGIDIAKPVKDRIAKLEEQVEQSTEPVAAIVELLDPEGESQYLCWSHIADTTYGDRPRKLLYLASPKQGESFQQQVQPWLLSCFGEEIASDRSERNHRFLEEALELVQACGCTKEEAIQLVDYVYGRPLGESHQEVGGVMVTLAALCLAQKLDMHEAGATELKRIWTKVEQIRAKQAAKPKHSPLPGHAKDLK